MELSSTMKYDKNGRSRRARAGHTPPILEDADARYAAALRLVQTIDRDLQRGTRHYYDTCGKLLISLDEVIQAILADNLVVDKPVRLYEGQEAINWSTVGEFSAPAVA